jgi:hypothetical protein
MALVVDDLTTAMINAVKQCPDGGDSAFQKLGEATENYLCNNTVAMYSWVGTMSSHPFSPDPTVIFQAKLSPSGSVFTCKPSSFDDFISKFATFLQGIKIEGASGFSLSPLQNGTGTFTAKQIGKLDDEKDVDKAMKSAFSEIAKGIINGWQSYFQSSGSGIHSSYTGSASLTSVN